MESEGIASKEITVVVLENGSKQELSRTLAGLNGYKEIVSCEEIPAPEKMKGSWVFIVGAGEIVSPELAEFIQQGTYSSFTSVEVSILRTFMKQRMRTHHPFSQPRIIRKQYASTLLVEWDRMGLQIKPSPPISKGLVLDPELFITCHLHVQSCLDWIERNTQAKARADKKAALSFWKTCFIKPLKEAFQYYIIQGGFKQGKAGMTWMVLGFYQKIYEYMLYNKINYKPYCTKNDFRHRM